MLSYRMNYLGTIPLICGAGMGLPPPKGQIPQSGSIARCLDNMYSLAQLISVQARLTLVAWAMLLTASGALLAQEGSEPLDKKIDRLIHELGDEKYSVRQRAQEELAELGFEAYEALSAAKTDDDLEIAARAKYLLLLIEAQWSAEYEPEEVRRWLGYYQSHSREVRLEVLNVLPRLPGGIGIPTLCRLVRFEKSTYWSKQAAVAILDWEPIDQEARDGWAKTLRAHLGGSSRPAAHWLHTYLRFRDDPKTALSQWAKLVREEQAVLQSSPDQSSPRIVAALLYYLAIAQADQGDKESAENTAKQARQLSSSRSSSSLDTAVALQRRGRLRWAELEYRQVIDAGATKPKVEAQSALSEMWHDQGNDLAAAKLLEEMLTIDNREVEAALKDTPLERTAEEVRARMCYFFACHWADKGDRNKQQEYLDEAIKHDPAELDTLIARYRLPDTTPEYHQKTIELVEQAAAALRQMIGESPGEPTFYNQFAWLVGNTEGDLDEALRYARKAVQLRPQSGALLDTLAHVYFAKGDLENAVKFQTKAVRFQPHSGLIVRKLDVFRKALEEKKKNEAQDQDGKDG